VRLSLFLDGRDRRGESLANWWLDHPDVPRERIADWYVGVVQAAVVAAIHSAARAGL